VHFQPTIGEGDVNLILAGVASIDANRNCDLLVALRQGDSVSGNMTLERPLGSATWFSFDNNVEHHVRHLSRSNGSGNGAAAKKL
jgi:hypothetical protein